MELKCKVQNYAWGKIGVDSAVANLAQDEKIESSTPYAELWMGTHVNGPSTIKNTDTFLKDYISKDPKNILGDKCFSEFKGELPFLFKILSVNKALSIQAHPDKKLAEKLHSERPEIYKDPNHKPEMAIALTDFEGLCGFRSLAEIRRFINEIPQLKSVCSCPELTSFLEDNEDPELLKKVFEALMTCNKETLAENLQSWKCEINQSGGIEREELFIRLMNQYPNDVGCFVIYFLNHVSLKAGEAMFLGPNLPHAYLSGDCVECMACSDNVVRSGLTPKLIDVETLCSMLIYKSITEENVKFKPIDVDENTEDYIAPVNDFSVSRIQVKKGGSKKLVKRESASIVIITSGCCERFGKGTVLFLKAGEELALDGVREDIVAFQAFC